MGLADYRGSEIRIWCMRDKVKAAEIAKYYFPPQFEANKSNYDSPKLKNLYVEAVKTKLPPILEIFMIRPRCFLTSGKKTFVTSISPHKLTSATCR